jgi:2-keto-4-pentenoate hydratase/2-oxohepta-3-ene-1,7-dioic acid hydratase in catechol pathway
MKIIRFIYENEVCTGRIEGNRAVISLHVDSSDGRDLPLGEVTLLPPVIPSKIVAVGLNYKDHASELNMELPKDPILFLKPPSSVIGHGEHIVFPDMANQVDYEAELGVVIKDQIKDIPEEEAQKHILGYTCVNDVTARDLQKKDGQWTRAKSFDTFSPVGPCIETELDPGNLSIRSFLNGEIQQNSSTSDMIFGINELVSYISRVMTLMPGDIISTDTPPGIGPMSRGDKVSVEIEGIGSLENTIR